MLLKPFVDPDNSAFTGFLLYQLECVRIQKLAPAERPEIRYPETEETSASDKKTDAVFAIPV